MSLKRSALLLFAPAIVAAAQPPGIPDGWSDAYVHVNGARLHYYHAAPAPSKPAIVMVHGVTDIGLSWTTLTWKLQDNYDIYMLDARAHGLSDPFLPADDGDTLVKDVVAFVESMKLVKPILMGHSMGAATVMRIGAEYPELPRAIVMLDPMLGMRAPPPVEPPGAAPASVPAPSASPPPAPDRLRISMMGSPETLVAQNNYSLDDLVATCRRNTPKWDLVDCQYWALSKRQYHGPYTSEASSAMRGVMVAGDSLSKITAPALILKADAAPEVRKSNEQAAKAMPNGRLVHINGAGHNLHHDELNQTVAVVTEFLSKLKDPAEKRGARAKQGQTTQ